ncbi:Vps54-like protein-domain-containing protein [Rhypophila decipiens]|uniref:Vps54-like protein-domain-containing protein n=1 Tax=Rhypophila decipiens TaxID=261697 RepID=A0AAN6Y503_9PEZI|nr:Vps54-like protein-domain-containing protein [Rhypophila decipiens]
MERISISSGKTAIEPCSEQPNENPRMVNQPLPQPAQKKRFWQRSPKVKMEVTRLLAQGDSTAYAISLGLVTPSSAMSTIHDHHQTCPSANQDDCRRLKEAVMTIIINVLRTMATVRDSAKPKLVQPYHVYATMAGIASYVAARNFLRDFLAHSLVIQATQETFTTYVNFGMAILVTPKHHTMDLLDALERAVETSTAYTEPLSSNAAKKIARGLYYSLLTSRKTSSSQRRQLHLLPLPVTVSAKRLVELAKRLAMDTCLQNTAAQINTAAGLLSNNFFPTTLYVGLKAWAFLKDKAWWEAPAIHLMGYQRAGQMLCWKRGEMPPIVRTGRLQAAAPASSAYKPLTSLDIPPVTLANIAQVDAAVFKPYLDKIGKFYESAGILEDDSPGPEKPLSATIMSSGPCLTNIPTVYFNSDFHLENPRIFDVVTERSELVPAHATGGAPRTAQATNAILQENISWYVDTVEMHRIASISLASASFSTTLGSLHDMHLEVTDSVGRIKALRDKLHVLDGEIAIHGDLFQKRQRLRNLHLLQDCILQLKHIVDGLAACESLVDNGDLDKAVDSITSLEKLISGEPSSSGTPCIMEGQTIQLGDLSSAAALQGVYEDLATLRVRIGKAYEARCLGLLLGDLRRHVEAVSKQEVLIRWTGAFVLPRGGYTQEVPALPSYLSSTGGLSSELHKILTGLHRAKQPMIVSTYREAVLKEIRNIIQRPLPSANDKDLSHPQKSSILARNLRALEPGNAGAMFAKIYVGITETLRRVSTQVKLLLEVTSLIHHDSSIAARQTQELHKAIDLPSLLSEAVDVAQCRILKLLEVRSDQSTHLSRTWFLRYFSLNLGFVSECESISGRSGTAFKTVVNKHIKQCIQHYGETEIQTLTQGMESDQWEATDFTENDTAELNRILSSCSTTDPPPEWSDGLKVWIPCGSNGDPPEGQSRSSSSKSRTKTKACIGEQEYVLPSSAILCMNGLSSFLQLVSGMPSIAPDISALLVSYLRHFLACCTRLVLDAGARESAAKLKNITSKHLALASQALGFIAILTSYVRELFRRKTGLRVVEFDELEGLYLEHQNRIHDKLVDIMSRLLASRVRALEGIDWENDGQKEAHPYMAELVKDTTSLHRILTKIMPKEQVVSMVMVPVFLTYKAQLGQAFQEIIGRPSMTEVGLDSLLLDVQYFESNLGRIGGFDDAGGYLTTIVKAAQHVKMAVLDAPSAAAVETEREENEES